MPTSRTSTLSLHDALPISAGLHLQARAGAALTRRRVDLAERRLHGARLRRRQVRPLLAAALQDRKSTRLNSSHLVISYAVFCLKKKKSTIITKARSRVRCI